jgi:hypothetical protein
MVINEVVDPFDRIIGGNYHRPLLNFEMTDNKKG